MFIKFEGKTHKVEDVNEWGDEKELVLEDGTEYKVFESREIAGKAAREYWQDLADNDPSEFTCIVGEKALVAWALGQTYAVGSVGVNNLQQWLDLSLDYPEEHHAGYDGVEVEADRISPKLGDCWFEHVVCSYYRNCVRIWM